MIFLKNDHSEKDLSVKKITLKNDLSENDHSEK